MKSLCDRKTTTLSHNNKHYFLTIIRGRIKSIFLDCFFFVRLCVALCDPLWFNDLILTTKGHKAQWNRSAVKKRL